MGGILELVYSSFLGALWGRWSRERLADGGAVVRKQSNLRLLCCVMEIKSD